MFLKNCWYVAAWDHELVRKKMMRRMLLNQPVVLYRREDGSPVAMEDRCVHRHAPLSAGKVLGDNVECPYHGLLYDPSGQCIRVPGQATIPPNAKVASYPVVEKNRWVWIWMGDPALADPALIEDFHWLSDPAWRADGELLHLKGNYMLLVENLLDLSHLTFIHPTTLGTDAVAETPMKAVRDGNRVTVTRWVMNKPPPPFFQRAGGLKGDVDRWQVIEFAPPAFVKLDVGAAVAGTGAPEGNRSQGITMRNLNAITPETESTTHYFWAQAHNFATNDPSITRLLVDQVHTAFMEDLHIISLQQENIETRPDAVRVDINHDAGGIQARRIVENLIAAEQAQKGAAAAAAE